MHFGCFLFEGLKTTISKAKEEPKSSIKERTEIISSKWTQKRDHLYQILTGYFFQFCDIRNFGEFSNEIAKVVEFIARKNDKICQKKNYQVTRTFLQVFGSSHG
jgi:hypothetical protein